MHQLGAILYSFENLHVIILHQIGGVCPIVATTDKIQIIPEIQSIVILP